MEQDDPIGSPYAIRAVQRVTQILDLIQGNPSGFTLSQVSEVTQLPKSSAYRYLTTLLDRRYILRDPLSGLFRMGPAFIPLQSRQLSVLADRIRPRLAELRDECGETINFGVLEGYRVSYLAIIESPHHVRQAPREGERDPIHCTALGKAMATLIDTERVEAILEGEGMPPQTPATITSVSAYLEELDSTRARGYAVDDCENEADGRCVAVPVARLGLPAAISMSAPVYRMSLKDLPDIAVALQKTARLMISDITGPLSAR